MVLIMEHILILDLRFLTFEEAFKHVLDVALELGFNLVIRKYTRHDNDGYRHINLHTKLIKININDKS